MRFRTIALATVLSAGLTHTGDAYAPRKGAERPLVTAGRAARLHRDVTWKAPQGALASLPSWPSWRVMWDHDTDVPLRLWGPPISAPNANSDATAAEAAARQFLAQHLSLIAPGASASDFTMVTNRVDGALRSVAFAQHANGLAVVGGAISFTFSHDRLILVGSTALPNVSVRMPGGSLSSATLASSAKSWLGQAGYDIDVKAQGARVIVPVIHSRGNRTAPQIEYRVAETLTVESTREAGRWNVWLDASDASPIARHQELMFATGKILFDTPDRYPLGTRSAKPAPEANHTIAAAAVMSLMDGTVTWAGDAAAQVTLGLAGPHIRITNKAGALATDTMQLDPGATLVWSKASDELADSQLDAFVAASTAKQFVKTRLAPDLAWLDGQLSVNVNENQTCNAFSTGDDIHFFKGNTQCENTGRISDVVYHEFGHSVHANSIIDGVGAFDGSLSEGLADTLAASITGDHGMGRGFFHTDEALRDLDPVGVEKKWPDDADGEVHDEGEIIGEALWDLRTALETQYGAEEGFTKFLALYRGVLQRASDIPTSYAAVLVTDDDDGNLANGTPNECLINAAFAPHGLTDPAVSLGLTAPQRDGFQISFSINPPNATQCPPPSVASATLTWAPRGGSGGDIELAATGNTWAANIPTQPDGTVVNYHVTLKLADGSSITYPQNPADPDYQFYVGNVEKLWCADFESGLGDWTVGGTPAQRIEWEAGSPMGIGGDPKAAYAGTGVLGIDLGGDDGLYYPRTTQFVESPVIDLQGNTNVRLQYYRWLNAEDGAYDQASIFANDQQVWTNYAGPAMTQTEVNHTDKEWRFQDVDLAAQAAAGTIKLKFQLVSDPGLELAGWTVDEVCIVKAGPPSNLCGNHNVDPGETCDDGNTTDGDGCSSTCGADGGGGGCCSVGTNPAGPALLSLATIGLLIVRRRRRR